MYEVTIQVPTDGGYVQKLLHSTTPHSTQRLSSGTMIEEISQIPSFSFTITPANDCYYDCLCDRKTLIAVRNTKTGEIEFDGIILTSEERMTAQGKLFKKVVCEGFMGYLCDTVQMYHHYEAQTPTQFLQSLLDNHNAQMPDHKKIYLGMCNISTNTNSKTTAYRTTLDEIKENLLERLGGEIKIRRDDGRLYLDYLESITNGTTSDTVIELARNMKTMTVGSDSLSIITRLIPLGAQINDETAERVTVADAMVNGQIYGKVYIDDDAAIAQYGYIVGTAEFDEITLPENLYEAACAYLAENNRIRTYYEATVLDLSSIDSSVTGLRIGNTYRFKNAFMNLDESLRLLKRTVDIYKPYAPAVLIGDKTLKLTDVASRQNRLIEYEIPKIKSDTLTAAKNIASNLITAATTGYVVIRPNEILIMDTDDVKTATSVWRFNSGGLGYSHSDTAGDAYDGRYDLAMTMNGEIVADFITAGVLRGIEISNGDGTFHVDVNGTVSASAINITGGSINITTNDESYNTIQLNSNGWHYHTSPLQWELRNDGINRKILGQAGGIFFYDGNDQRMTISSVGSITTKGDISSDGNITAGSITAESITSNGDIFAAGTSLGMLASRTELRLQSIETRLQEGGL